MFFSTPHWTSVCFPCDSPFVLECFVNVHWIPYLISVCELIVFAEFLRFLWRTCPSYFHHIRVYVFSCRAFLIYYSFSLLTSPPGTSRSMITSTVRGKYFRGSSLISTELHFHITLLHHMYGVLFDLPSFVLNCSNECTTSYSTHTY